MNAGWSDRLSVGLSTFILVVVAGLFISRNGFDGITDSGQNLTWLIVRGSGITAYSLLTLSTLWGVMVSSHSGKEWSPPSVSMVVHTALSWLALIFVLFHALLLLYDQYYSYGLADLFVPFQGPYRPFQVGLGIVSFWLLLFVTLSWLVRKRLGYRNWHFIHQANYLAFLLVTAHGYLAGTDAQRLGFLIVFFVSISSVFLLLGYRVGMKRTHVQPSTAAPNNTVPPE